MGQKKKVFVRFKSPILFLVFVLIFYLPISAWAEMQYFVLGYDNTTLGKSSYGTNGYNYVMQSPTIYYQHVSSLYVFNWISSPVYMAEVGWFANPWQSGRKPRFFCAWIIADNYYEKLLDYPEPGTNHYYTVRNVTGSNEWRWYVDGVLKHSVSSLGGFKRGYSIGSRERNDLRETNYSHFWNLRKRDSQGNWYYFSNLQCLDDTDPNYYFDKISEKEFYVRKK